MLLKRNNVLKKLKSHLWARYKDNWVFSSQSELFDLYVSKIGKDCVFKLIMENEYSKIEDISRFIKNSPKKSFFIDKEYYLAVYTKEGIFNFIKIE